MRDGPFSPCLRDASIDEVLRMLDLLQRLKQATPAPVKQALVAAMELDAKTVQNCHPSVLIQIVKTLMADTEQTIISDAVIEVVVETTERLVGWPSWFTLICRL